MIDHTKILDLYKKSLNIAKIVRETRLCGPLVKSIILNKTGCKCLNEVKKKIGFDKIMRKNLKDYNEEYTDLELIKLFQEVGRVTKLAKLVNIPSVSLRGRILNLTRCKNIIEAKHKLGVKNKLKSSTKNRVLKVYNLYKKHGTLEKASKEIGVTRERIRQILKEGEKHDIFRYKPSFRYDRHSIAEKIKSTFRRQDIIDEFIACGKESTFCNKFNIDVKYLKEIENFFGVNFNKIKNDIRKKSIIDQYNKIVSELGHHPTTTEMRMKHEWRRVWCKIDWWWGSIANFRKELKIKRPNFRIHSE